MRGLALPPIGILAQQPPPAGAPAHTAPYLEEFGSQQAFSGSRSSDTPTLSSASQVTGALTVLVYYGVHSNDITVPAGQGWTKVAARRSTGPFIQVCAFLKVWGLGGQTDDSTPTFTFTTTSGPSWIYGLVMTNPDHGSNPWTSVADALAASATDDAVSASATPAAPAASDTGSNRTIVRAWITDDDNTLISPSEGTLILGDTAGNLNAGKAGAITLLEGTTTSGSTGTATVTESTNGNDAGASLTLVLKLSA